MALERGKADPPPTVQIETTSRVRRVVGAIDEGEDGRSYLLVFEEGRAWMCPLPARGELVVGRADSCGLVIADASVSRQHLRVSIGPGEATVADLGSQNGTRVNGEVLVGARPLASGDVVMAGSVTLVFHSNMRVSAPQRLVAPAQFRQRCEEEVERALRYQRPLAMLCLSLRPSPVDQPVVAAALEGRLRLLDLVTWGGADHLLALLPETDAARAPIAAERLAGLLESVAAGVTVGVASCPTDGCDVSTLLASARAAAAVASDGERVAIASHAHREIAIGEARALIADPVMSRLYGLVERLAQSDLPVLVGGETGSGKELVASAIHHFSPRKQGPLLTVNCAALTDTLLEGELFGWERGAFSGAVSARAGHLESATGGTIFLDEIGELSPAGQAKLLRVIETRRVMRLGDSRERPIDIRLVAATNRDLEDEVRRGRFRQDLFFRISGARLWIPPLRDRPSELPILAGRFLNDARARLGRPPLTLAGETVLVLSSYRWPGNVRELRNVCDYLAVTVGDGPVLREHLPEGLLPTRAAPQSDPPADLPPAPEPTRPRPPSLDADLASPIAALSRAAAPMATPLPPEPPAAPFRPLGEELDELMRTRIIAALAYTAGNQTKAAQLLGMPRRTFVSKLRELRIGEAGDPEP